MNNVDREFVINSLGKVINSDNSLSELLFGCVRIYRKYNDGIDEEERKEFVDILKKFNACKNLNSVLYLFSDPKRLERFIDKLETDKLRDDLNKIFKDYTSLFGLLCSCVKIHLSYKKEGNSEQDDWIFGFHAGNLMVVSSARMKGPDNKPRDRLEVPEELYLARVVFTGIHEIGHDVVKAGHYLPAVWINARTGHRLEMGPHCTDNGCVMYEVVDIVAPPPEEGYMLLGDKKI